MKSKEIQIRFC